MWRVTHTVSYTQRQATGEKNYYAEAFAAVDTGGTRVFWGSNWRDFKQDYTDTYQALLPPGWVERVPR